MTFPSIRHWRAAFDAVDDPICLLDKQGKIMRCNAALARFVGKSHSEINGLTCREVLHAALEAPQDCPLQRSLGSNSREESVVSIGSRWFEARVDPMSDEDGRVIGFVHILLDITERRRAENALRRRNADLALLNLAGRELTSTLNPQEVAERLLQRLVEIVGTAAASVWLRGEGAADKDRLICQAASPHDQTSSPVGLSVCMGQGVVGWVAQTGESVIVNDVRKDNRFFSGIDEQIGFHTTSLLAAPLRARGAIMGTLELVNKRDGDFDEHDRMFAEALAASAAIAFDNARLIQTLRQRTTELAARNEELDAFTHSVAHQLKNPLSYVTGYASILEAEIETLSPDSVREFVRTMDRSARRMSEIIDGLLLLAHVRQEEVESEPLDMEDVVTEAQHRLNGTLEKYSAEIITPEMWPEALGYRPWVEEVWVNYISNAIKYGGNPEEGIPPRVELGFEDEELEGKKRRDRHGSEPQIRFWVRDNGSGLAPEEQDQLFVPFKRLHLNRAKGHGLGLATVRRIVEKLGGRVEVESEVGRGSVFSFTLPAADGYE